MDAISFCRMCPALCGIKVTVEDGVAIRVSGDPEHPLSRSYLCPKGRKMAALPDDPERLDEPMMRDSGGNLAPVDWDTAIGDLVERLEHALSRPSPGLVPGNRREVQHTNSTLAWSVGGAPRPQPRVYLSPGDVAAAGVEDGAAVEVRSCHGALGGTARIDSAMGPGTVVVPHGFSEPNVGHLSATDVDVDPLTGMPTLVGVPVCIRPQLASPAPVESQRGR